MSIVTVFSWNVHNIKSVEHAQRVISNIAVVDPDIFCLAEVVGEPAYELIARRFPEHNFYMTYGRESQEMLVGVRRSLQAFFSQKTEFRSGNASVRPAALVTIMNGESPVNILFVHPKSFSTPCDIGQRDDFFRRVFELKKLLDKKTNGNARYLVCGDMNIMGMAYAGEKYIEPEAELNHLTTEANKVGLTLLTKSHGATWAGTDRRSLTGDLDQVLASASVGVVQQQDENHNFLVRVRGWVDFPENSPERRQFIGEVSDHCSLTVQFEL